MPRLSTFFVNSLIVLFSFTVSLILAELGLRFWLLGTFSSTTTHSTIMLWRPDSALGWMLRPNIDVWLRTTDYSINFQTNSKGFNDVEHIYMKPPGVSRVVVLGDSFMEAYQVPLSASFAQQLSLKLNQWSKMNEQVEVINLGVGGYGTTQEYLMLQEQGSKYEPDIVLLTWLPVNDVRNNHKGLETMLWGGPDTAKVRGRPFAIIEPGSVLSIEPPDEEFMYQWLNSYKEKRNQKQLGIHKDDLLLWYYLERLIGRMKVQKIPKYDPNVWLGGYINAFDTSLSRWDVTNEEYELLWSEAEAVTWHVLNEMKLYSEKIGAQFCVFTVPTRFQVEAGYRNSIVAKFPSLLFDLEKLNNKLKQFTEQENICLIDLLPEFIKIFESNGNPLHHQYDDRHWNKYGHELAADLIAEALKSEKFN